MDRFCGRKTELGKLGRVFARVQKGETGAVLVSGPAGTGKTALVTRFAVDVEMRGALFVYGKADAALRSSPFAAVAAAMDMLVKKAIAEHPDHGDALKQAVRKLLNPDTHGNLASLLSLVPALSYLFKDPRPQTVQPDKPGTPSANLRLLSVLEAFAAALNRPLVFFLDDLQWMDAASHGFLRYLAVSSRLANFLLVMAHRREDPEVGPDLERTADLFKSLETTLSLPLSGLTRRDTRGLLTRRLASGQDLIPLADLCHQKTAGNPFYLTRLLDDLLEKGVIFRNAGEWAYDIAYISGLGFTENVADLIIERITLLQGDCLALLKQAACIHGEISVRPLMATSGFSREKIETLLWKPVQQDLLDKTPDGFAFAHDKILEAVEALLGDEEALDIHRRLVTFYLAAERRDDLDTNIFAMLYHYGFCSQSFTDPTFRKEMAVICFQAGEKARRQSAYDLALAYFIQGKSHFPGDIWAEAYDQALRFCRRIARCAYLAGDFDTAERIFQEVDARARSYAHRLPTEMIKIPFYQARQKEAQALATGLAMLRHLGVRICENPSRMTIVTAIIKAWVRFIFSRKARLKRKRMEPDSHAYQAVQCLSALGAIAYYLSPERLLPLVTATAFNLSLRYGNMAETPVCYITFGMILNEITGGIKWGRRLGAMAREISRDFSHDRHKTKELTLGNVFLDHWDKSLAQGIDDFNEAATFCQRQGDHEYFGYNALGALHAMMVGGTPLPMVGKAIAEKKKILARINNQSALTTASFIQQAVANLAQGVPRPWILDGDHFEEARLDDGISGIITEFNYYKFCAAFYCGRTDRAAEIREVLATCDETAIDAYQYYHMQFLSALVDIGLQKEKKKIRRHLKRLKKFANRNDAIYGSKYLLAMGERLRLKGDPKAADVYRDAAAAAERHGFRFEQALAFEGLGMIAREAGDEAAAGELLARAVGLYRGWGLKWRQGLFNDDRPVDHTSGPAQAASADQADGGMSIADAQALDPADAGLTEGILATLRQISGAAVIHAAARMTQNWKSCIYIDGEGIHRPATFVFLPEKMLNFACAADEIIRADAVSMASSFLDTAYYWKKRPSSLLVVPADREKALCFENYEHSLPEADLLRLARRLFASLDLPDTGELQDSGVQIPDSVVHKRNCDRIREQMTEKAAFKNPKLTLTGFAREVKMSQRTVTDAINMQLGQNFRTFVNSYRIDAVKKALNDPANRHKTILEIAFDQGFNSKSTFNAVFKQFVGATPTAYMAAQAEKKGADRQQAS